MTVLTHLRLNAPTLEDLTNKNEVSQTIKKVDLGIIADQVINASRDGYRTKREGFPNAQRGKFPLPEFSNRSNHLRTLSDRFSQGEELKLGFPQSEIGDRISIGLRCFEHLNFLQDRLKGQKPSFYQVLAMSVLDPEIAHGDLSASKLILAAKTLRTIWFSEVRAPSNLWKGDTKNVYDALSVHCLLGPYNTYSPAQALQIYFRENSREVIGSHQLASEIGLKVYPRDASRLLCASLQLLTASSMVIEHPQHHNHSKTQDLVSVWSANSGRWIKPPLENPELLVLAHAANGKEKGSWLSHLYSNAGLKTGIFNHHTIIAAARRLHERGLIYMDKAFISENDPINPPNGNRAYIKIWLQPAAAKFVQDWHEVPVGQLLVAEKYEALRTLIVERINLNHRRLRRNH